MHPPHRLRMRLAPLILSVVALAGCELVGPATRSDARLDAHTVRLRIGEHADLSGIVVRLTDLRDSRCPRDVECVWAGEAQADLTLEPPTGPYATLTLVLPNGGAPEPMAALGFEATLLEVSPYPVSDAEMSPQDREAVIRVVAR